MVKTNNESLLRFQPLYIHFGPLTKITDAKTTLAKSLVQERPWLY